jgi:non-reducing end alpha-L-arabinofuranosidase
MSSRWSPPGLSTPIGLAVVLSACGPGRLVIGGYHCHDGSVEDTPCGTDGATPNTGGSPGTGGAVPNTGGSPGTGGVIPDTGGSPNTGGSPGTGGSGGDTTLPCDILTKAGNTCVAAHSTVRALFSSYSGPLYQLCRGTASAGPSSCRGTMQDVGVKDGYADAAAHDAFCAGASCTITKIYDQSGQYNDLEPAPRGGAKATPDNPAKASDLEVTIHGHSAYGILLKPGMGYRTGCAGCNIKQGNGTARGDEPQTIYMVTSRYDLVDGCCFDYGNAETNATDDGNGCAEAVYFGGGVVWGTGSGGKPGPWVMADLENGLYAGWEDGQDKNISTNTPLPFDYVSAIVIGDVHSQNGEKGRLALYGGDATSGALKAMYDGIRPFKPGYVPMQKQGSIVLGIAGDNSDGGGGRFYEGVMANGAATKATLDALQAAIVAARYGQ